MVNKKISWLLGSSPPGSCAVGSPRCERLWVPGRALLVPGVVWLRGSPSTNLSPPPQLAWGPPDTQGSSPGAELLCTQTSRRPEPGTGTFSPADRSPEPGITGSRSVSQRSVDLLQSSWCPEEFFIWGFSKHLHSRSS